MKEARLNIQLDPSFDRSRLKELQEALYSAATSGYANDDEFEVFVTEDVVGVAIVYDEMDELGAIEAGAVLGYVHRCWEGAEVQGGHTTWKSTHGLTGKKLQSPT